MKTTPLSLLDLIYKKRDGLALSKDEIQKFVSSLGTKSSPPDYQIASLLAFAYTKGLDSAETSALVHAMRYSGLQFQYKGFPKNARFVDKHSTGGVGDKITIPLAPLIVACSKQIYFPTIAGRGLGHTGGTVDKLESIPGFSCAVNPSKFYRLLKKNRLVFLRQTENIAPADRILYALRDVTGTVESIPLITASILSKKLSESLHSLLLDVKFGSGAFMQDPIQAEALARSLMQSAQKAGVKATAYLTSMNSPLGHYSGNRLEILESIQILKGVGPRSSTELTKVFAEEILVSSGEELPQARSKIEAALKSGLAFEVFEKSVKAQGGSLSKLISAEKKAAAKIYSLRATRSGVLRYDVRLLGLSLVALGGGRKRKEDSIDPSVGFFHPLEHGDKVQAGDEILRIIYTDGSRLRAAKQLLPSAVQIVEEIFPKIPLIRKILKE